MKLVLLAFALLTAGTSFAYECECFCCSGTECSPRLVGSFAVADRSDCSCTTGIGCSAMYPVECETQLGNQYCEADFFGTTASHSGNVVLISPWKVVGWAVGATVLFAAIVFGITFIVRYRAGSPVFSVEVADAATGSVTAVQAEEVGCCASTSVGRAVVASLLMIKSEFFLVLFAIALAEWHGLRGLFGDLGTTWVNVVFYVLLVFVLLFAVETAAAVAAMMMEFCPSGTGRCVSHNVVWSILVFFEVPNLLLGVMWFVLFIVAAIAEFAPIELLLLAVSITFCSCCICACVCCCRTPKAPGGYALIQVRS